jgi:hypothetical protein
MERSRSAARTALLRKPFEVEGVHHEARQPLRDAVRQVNLVFNKPGIPKVAPLSPRLKHRLIAGAAATMLAFALGLLVAVFGARAADEPAPPQPTAERASTDSIRVQPTAKEFAPPNQPDVSAAGAHDIDLLYRQLIGPPAATSSGSHSNTRLRAAPSDDTAGSFRRWTSPR